MTRTHYVQMMTMIFCFIGLLAAAETPWFDASLKHCAYNRTEVLECVRKYSGAGSRGICPEHIAQLKSGVLNPIEKFFAYFYTIEKVMTDCDADRDGYISPHDCAVNGEHCVIHCNDVGNLYRLICKPARDMDFRARKVQCFSDYDHKGRWARK